GLLRGAASRAAQGAGGSLPYRAMRPGAGTRPATKSHHGSRIRNEIRTMRPRAQRTHSSARSLRSIQAFDMITREAEDRGSVLPASLADWLASVRILNLFLASCHPRSLSHRLFLPLPVCWWGPTGHALDSV